MDDAGGSMDGRRHPSLLIADVRGYTLFTQERGDEAAAKLAARFAEIAREGVAARAEKVIELRGDGWPWMWIASWTWPASA
jgi:class 3 adenylate cyclase